MFMREAERGILAVAAETDTAVITNMPFDKACLFKAAEGTDLPDFAADIGVENWVLFFLKWVISNPVVTVAVPATSNPDHMAENIGALRGPVPDQPMRDRMLAHMQTIPAFATGLESIGFYPGKAYETTVCRG